MNEVQYQTNELDAFYHRYYYDAENRLTDVETSRDKVLWERDAYYEYYRHGPLARMVLGQQQVQGVDYAYTIQGWLKGINSTAVGDGTYDMGGDGNVTSPNRYIARDVYGFSLNYFAGDYESINVDPFTTVSNSLSNVTDNKATGNDLFNGNIRAMLVNIPKLGDAHLYGYRYDQLNRIVAMNSYTGLNSSNVLTASGTDNYRERVSYDANGNILGYLRNGTTAESNSLAMDSLTYKYYAGNNRLKYVKDSISSGNYSMDIDDQDDNNYGYDEIGNLTSDVAEGITNIDWNVYGKIKSISKSSGNISYKYDASGNRISKTHNGKTTWYVRDASGNVMSIYVKDEALNDNHLTQNEVHLYGSSRLGILNVDEDMEVVPLVETPVITRGDKFFELSNHLGNVLVTISDKKIAFAQASPNEELIDYYEADVVTANDYYPGGMMMPERKFDVGSKYRYGFNGKENDNEVKGEGNQQDYGFRIYDLRVVRFLSVDPVTKEYPELTPYQFASNSPISGIDLDGKEFYSVHIKEFPDGTRTKIGVINYTNIKQKDMTNIQTENGYGPQGNVGVNYTIIKVDNDGKEINRVGFNIKNYYGVYNGPNNPKKYWEKPDADGNYYDDYSLPPINETDLNGMIHDKDFDELRLAGLSGVMDDKSTPANEAYRARAAKIVEKQKKGEKDVVTGKPVTKESAKAAQKYAEKGIKSFRTAEAIKRKLNTASAKRDAKKPVRPSNTGRH